MGHAVVRPGGPSPPRVLLAVTAAVTAAVMWLAVPAHAPPAGASLPPHPAGTSARALVPHVYPGGGLVPFGDADPVPTPTGALNAPMAAAVRTPDGGGLWLFGADGGVFTLGDAPFEGSLGGLHLQGPIVAAAATPDGRGYWMAALDGGVFALGDARFFGSMGGSPLNQPIVGMAATPDGGGYWLVAADGGVFAFGDATYLGGRGGQPLVGSIVGMAATPTGNGYWLAAGDGGIFAYGDARFEGSEGGQSLTAYITGMAATADGGGYWLVAGNGAVYPLGDARSFGSLAGPAGATPVSALVPTADGDGYWLLSPDAWDYSYANPPPAGTFPDSAAIVAAAQSQVQPDPSTGYFCNLYGPCEAWCALFASWALQQAGIPIPTYSFTGDIYGWALQQGTVLPPTATPVPGDVVLYGTGPSSSATSVHAGIVVQAWPDGAIVTVEGDAGPGANGYMSVIINGPYLPAGSLAYNGVGIYAYVQP